MLTGEKKKFEPATENPWFLAIVADIAPDTGYCYAIERIRWRFGDDENHVQNAASQNKPSSS